MFDIFGNRFEERKKSNLTNNILEYEIENKEEKENIFKWTIDNIEGKNYVSNLPNLDMTNSILKNISHQSPNIAVLLKEVERCRLSVFQIKNKLQGNCNLEYLFGNGSGKISFLGMGAYGVVFKLEIIQIALVLKIMFYNPSVNSGQYFIEARLEEKIFSSGEIECFIAKRLYLEMMVKKISPHVALIAGYKTIDGLSNVFPYYYKNDKFGSLVGEFVSHSNWYKTEITHNLIAECALGGTLDRSFERITINEFEVLTFQFIYTYAQIFKVFPGFQHRDSHLDNFLLQIDPNYSEKNKRYYIYCYQSRLFKIPVIRYQFKIWDFGYSDIIGETSNISMFSSWPSKVGVFKKRTHYSDLQYTFCRFLNYFSLYFKTEQLEESQKLTKFLEEHIVPYEFRFKQENFFIENKDYSDLNTDYEFTTPGKLLKQNNYLTNKWMIMNIKRTKPGSIDKIFPEETRKNNGIVDVFGDDSKIKKSKTSNEEHMNPNNYDRRAIIEGYVLKLLSKLIYKRLNEAKNRFRSKFYDGNKDLNKLMHEIAANGESIAEKIRMILMYNFKNKWDVVKEGLDFNGLWKEVSSYPIKRLYEIIDSQTKDIFLGIEKKFNGEIQTFTLEKILSVYIWSLEQKTYDDFVVNIVNSMLKDQQDMHKFIRNHNKKLDDHILRPLFEQRDIMKEKVDTLLDNKGKKKAERVDKGDKEKKKTETVDEEDRGKKEMGTVDKEDKEKKIVYMRKKGGQKVNRVLDLKNDQDKINEILDKIVGDVDSKKDRTFEIFKFGIENISINELFLSNEVIEFDKTSHDLMLILLRSYMSLISKFTVLFSGFTNAQDEENSCGNDIMRESANKKYLEDQFKLIKNGQGILRGNDLDIDKTNIILTTTTFSLNFLDKNIKQGFAPFMVMENFGDKDLLWGEKNVRHMNTNRRPIEIFGNDKDPFELDIQIAFEKKNDANIFCQAIFMKRVFYPVDSAQDANNQNLWIFTFHVEGQLAIMKGVNKKITPLIITINKHLFFVPVFIKIVDFRKELIEYNNYLSKNYILNFKNGWGGGKEREKDGKKIESDLMKRFSETKLHSVYKKDSQQNQKFFLEELLSFVAKNEVFNRVLDLKYTQKQISFDTEVSELFAKIVYKGIHSLFFGSDPYSSSPLSKFDKPLADEFLDHTVSPFLVTFDNRIDVLSPETGMVISGSVLTCETNKSVASKRNYLYIAFIRPTNKGSVFKEPEDCVVSIGGDTIEEKGMVQKDGNNESILYLKGIKGQRFFIMLDFTQGNSNKFLNPVCIIGGFTYCAQILKGKSAVMMPYHIQETGFAWIVVENLGFGTFLIPIIVEVI